MVKQFTTKLPNMKTYYDIHILSYSGDTIIINGISHSQMMKIAHSNPNLQRIEIVKEYEKKEKR